MSFGPSSSESAAVSQLSAPRRPSNVVGCAEKKRGVSGRAVAAARGGKRKRKRSARVPRTA